MLIHESLNVFIFQYNLAKQISMISPYAAPISFLVFGHIFYVLENFRCLCFLAIAFLKNSAVF